MGKTLDLIVRTFAQAPDANLCVFGVIALGLTDDPLTIEHEIGQISLGIWAIKQYIYGHLGYYITKKSIENGKKVKALHGAPCFYFGNKYAIKEHTKTLEL